LQKLSMAVGLQPFQVHDNDLVWVIHMDAKTKLLQNSSLRLDDLIFQGYVFGIVKLKNRRDGYEI
jgi:hypothetical protein